MPTASFDVALSFDTDTMDQISSTVYQRVYPQVFTGSTTVQQAGQQIDVNWNVTAAPAFDLSPITNGMALVRSHLLGFDAPPGVSKDDIRSALLQALTGSTFVMNIASMTLQLDGGGSSGSTTASAVVYVQVTTAGNTISFVPIKATATTADPVDQWLINALIVPQALAMAKTLLSGIVIPPLSFAGITLGAPVVSVVDGHVVVLANLSGGGLPDPTGFSPPGPPLALLLSANLRQAAANAMSAGFTKPFNTGGSIDLGITHASYSAAATVNSLSLTVTESALAYNFSANVTGNANAGVDVACSTVGVDYDLSASPNPTGAAGISMSGTTISANITNVPPFVIVLSPTGNPLQWILSALTDPLTQTLAAVFAPVISSALTGFSFALVTVPNIPITVQGFTFTVSPMSLSLIDAGGGILQVSGGVTVS